MTELGFEAKFLSFWMQCFWLLNYLFKVLLKCIVIIKPVLSLYKKLQVHQHGNFLTLKHLVTDPSSG